MEDFMKKLSLLIALFFPFQLNALDTFQLAEDAYKKADFAQSLKLYKQVAQTSSASTLYQSQLRIIASQHMLGQYLNAAKSAYSFDLPQEELWKARFLIYRISTARQVQSAYSPIWPQNSQDNASLENLSQAQWNEKITQDFEELWKLKSTLLNAPITQENIILNIKDTDTKTIPTLFDYVVLNWTDYLLSQSEPIALSAAAAWQDFSTENTNHKTQKALFLMQEASRLDGKNRADARIIWQAKAWLLPFKRPYLFSFEDQKSQYVHAAELLQGLTGYPKEKTSWWNKWKELLQNKPKYAQAYAAYEAAVLLEQAQKYQQSLELCQWAKENLGNNFYACDACAQLIQGITAPVFDLANLSLPQDPSDFTVSFTARNIDAVYIRIYRTEEAELKKLNGTAAYGPWNYLKDTNKKLMEAFLARTPYKTHSQKISYPYPYAYQEDKLTLPALHESGFYVVLISHGENFDPHAAPVQAFVLNQTDLALFAAAAIDASPDKAWGEKSFTADVFRLYTLNLKTGEPVSDADITYFLQDKKQQRQGKTNENGVLSIAQTMAPQNSKNFQIAPKAQKDGHTAFLSGWFNFYYRPPQLHKIYLETDLALYRPAQKVRLAVYGFKNTARGFVALPKDHKIEVTVRDPNYEEIYKQTLSTNDYGTAEAEFVLPETGVLGHYQMTASLNGKNLAHHSFRVEEYKRPEYEVSLNTQAQIALGKKAEITGHAQYYFGTALDNAVVSYKITQTAFQPRFCWWCPPVSGETKIIAQGETKTDKEGNFSFTFQAPQKADSPLSFLAQVYVRDASGREIETSHIYKLSPNPYFFDVRFSQGFYDAQTPQTLADIALSDINQTPIKGKVTVEIFELENVLTETEENNSYRQNSLENLYAKNKEIRKVKAETLSINAKPVSVQIPALSEGIYKLKLHHKQAGTQELVFLVADRHSRLALPETALLQKDTYAPKEQAKILIGAQKLKGKKRVEISQGQFLFSRQLIDGGVSVYHLPIPADTLGNLRLQWFGSSDYKIYAKNVTIPIHPKEKELSLEIAVPEVVKPAEKINWQARVKDALGRLVPSQISATIYDKSLDYYQKNNLLDFTNLWKETLSGSAYFDESEFSVYARTLDQVEKEERDYQPQPALPSINLSWRPMRYAMMKSRSLNALAAPKAVAGAAFATADMAIAEEGAIQQTALAAGAVNSSAENTAEAPRSDFSETAYFNARLSAPNGTTKLQFTMPQSLTAWNILALAFTKNADFGTFTAQTVTRKDLMVRLALPRFYREGDTSTIVVQATNVTAKKRSAQITLSVLLDGQDISKEITLEKLTRSVTIASGGTAELVWPVTLPEKVGVLAVSASLRAGEDKDAELRQIALLPAAERLSESTTAALENGSAVLSLKNLLTADNTRRVSTVNLRIDPGLLLSVFNAMPQLLQPYHQDIMSLTDRYVPLAVVHGLYQKYPILQQAVAKLPKRNTATPAWADNQDPARLMLLEETPWLRQAQGGAERQKFLTDLFNAKLVAQTRQQTEKELASYQTSSGGYSWLAGGNPSEYLTLNVLAGFAQILRYGGEIPQDKAQKALVYLAPKIEEYLSEKEPSYSALAHALYAAYVFTTFPKEWKEVSSAPVKKWLDYADKHAAFMTPLGQTYAAVAYHHLGEDTKAQNYMGLVLSRMKTDPVTGAYFAPEAQSWLWYNDTITTQAATLSALLELRPQATQEAAAMVKWLLFNRKAQAWQSTTQTAAVVYALLEYMQINGLLDDPAEYTIMWGNEKKELQFEPFDWQKPFVWTQQAAKVAPQYYTAQVTKRGGLTGFATLDAVYTTKQALPSPEGVLNVSREYLLKYTENGEEKVRPIETEEEIPVGAEIEVRLTLQTTSAFDFVVVSDPKPAGFENTDLLSGWSWHTLPVYREYRDAATHFFLDRVPAGTYTFSYTMHPTLAGEYHLLPAQVQSMYAPEFSAHTGSIKIKVK